MRHIALWAGLLAAALSLRADGGAGKEPAAAVPLLPLAIPGYELRVLDVRKPVVFEVNGSSVEGSLPVFVYSPVATQAEVARLLREASADLGRLGQKPEWTGEELGRVLAKLDAALALLAAKP